MIRVHLNYIIDGDLRDYVNDKWDNTEDVFEYHQEYSNQTLEDVILDLGKDYMKPECDIWDTNG